MLQLCTTTHLVLPVLCHAVLLCRRECEKYALACANPDYGNLCFATADEAEAIETVREGSSAQCALVGASRAHLHVAPAVTAQCLSKFAADISQLLVCAP